MKHYSSNLVAYSWKIINFLLRERKIETFFRRNISQLHSNGIIFCFIKTINLLREGTFFIGGGGGVGRGLGEEGHQ